MRISNRSLFKPKARSPYRIENKASADESTVYIYDEISWWGIDAKEFIKDFNGITSSTIHVRINSPGGGVFDGTAIYNAIKQHKSKTIVHVDGLAASIASIIALAGSEVRMAENAFMMIHEPFSIMIGTAQDMRDEADLLDKVGGTIANIYTQKSGMESSEVLDMMAAETWMTAQEALDNGFIDAIDKEDQKSNKSQSIMFDLSAYANVPDALKEHKDSFSARDVERILRDAGISAKQAKTIISEGYKDDHRDVDPPAEDLRDAGGKVENKVVEPLRDAEPKQPKPKDKVAELLIRAERMAPSRPENRPQDDNYSRYFLQLTN